MESTNRELLTQTLESGKNRIANALIPLDNLDDQQARTILAQYRVAIEPHFIAWITQAHQHSKSEKAQRILFQNIYDEITQDHPQMLRNFTDACKVQLTPETYKRVAEPILDMWGIFGERNSLQNITVAVILENTSLIFIPYLARIGKRLGCQDFKYTDTHGMADIEHARELFEGTLEEMQHANNPWNTINLTAYKTISFLEKILIP